nr:hypothetical protein CFP56_49953 [Quercus suber]
MSTGKTRGNNNFTAQWVADFRHVRDSLFSSSKLDFEPPTLPESNFHFRPRNYFEILDIIPVIVGIITRIEPAS